MMNSNDWRYLLCAVLFTFHCSLFTASAQSRSEWRDSLEVLNAQIAKDPHNLHLHLLKAEANINLEQ